jgi:hypothetical protein
MTANRLPFTCSHCDHPGDVRTDAITVHPFTPDTRLPSFYATYPVFYAFICATCGQPNTRPTGPEIRQWLTDHGARTVPHDAELTDPARRRGPWRPGEAGAFVTWLSRPAVRYVAAHAYRRETS